MVSVKTTLIVDDYSIMGSTLLFPPELFLWRTTRVAAK